MMLLSSFRKYFFLTAGLTCLIFSGCNPEARLAEAADRGEVMAQYELAIYYSELKPPQKTKSFEWMKRAAISRYQPAIKKLAEYYLTGYGTPVNYPRVAEWLSRYFEKNRNSAQALDAGKKILLHSTKVKELAAGLILCKIALTIENQEGEASSKIARSAADAIQFCINKFFYRLLLERNYNGAEKLLEFVRKVHREYPGSFSDEISKDLQQMQETFTEKINENQ